MMKQISTNSVAIIVPIESLQQALEAARAIGRISDDDEFQNFFSVPLNTSGSGDPTHYGCHTHCRKRVIDNIQALSESVEGSAYEITRLEKVETGKTFDTLIESMGLQKIEVIV